MGTEWSRHARWLLAACGVLLLGAFAMEARAGSIEKLVMPGELAAAHAKYEESCSSCHAPFSKAKQADLCLACHKDVREDIARNTGLHGRSKWVAGNTCAHCHSDHKGRTADIVQFNRSTFDHAATDFPLKDSHAALACGSCHAKDARFRDAPSNCASCHKDDDIHGGTLGLSCGDCHETTEWKRAKFDHAKTGFALSGGHADVTCAACHPGNRYEAASSRCASCHSIDDFHGGAMGSDCAQCHTTTQWSARAFDHNRNTRFPLRGAHAKAACETCHRDGAFSAPLDTACNACHRTDDIHRGRNGIQCQQCHAVTAWLPASFDHAKDGHFNLVGAHARAPCQSCHADGVVARATARACNDCHGIEDPHHGALGTDCARCHDETGIWTKVRFNHDLTKLPLLGLHAAVPCEACHADRGFAKTASACIACHRDDNPHGPSIVEDCGACHNPNGWGMWQFDHDTQTKFPLLGAHKQATCAACHGETSGKGAVAGSTCISCHRSDDKHQGRFGTDCADCHVSDSFKLLRMKH
jgi:hypothetical protein